MVHRSVIGSIERQVAHLLDSHGGAFPPWLAPVQLIVLPITADQLPQAEALARLAIAHGIRAEIASEGSLASRVRAHRLVPYQAVIGAAEAAADQVALRLRDGRKLPAMTVAEGLARITDMVRAYSTELWHEP